MTRIATILLWIFLINVMIYQLIEYLDQKVTNNDQFIRFNTEIGSFINYQILNDNSIDVEYGWMSYEEGENNEIHIVINENIQISKQVDAHSVYGGDYDDNEFLIFNTICEFKKWFDIEFDDNLYL